MAILICHPRQDCRVRLARLQLERRDGHSYLSPNIRKSKRRPKLAAFPVIGLSLRFCQRPSLRFIIQPPFHQAGVARHDHEGQQCSKDTGHQQPADERPAQDRRDTIQGTKQSGYDQAQRIDGRKGKEELLTGLGRFHPCRRKPEVDPGPDLVYGPFSKRSRTRPTIRP